MKNRFAIFILVVMGACAIREYPGGGPEDKQAPEIIFTFPQADSTHITDIDNIKIHFSERMNRSSVEQSIFISPPIAFESDWSGWAEIVLKLKNKLASGQTYVITLAVSAEDLQRNRLKESFQFAFSTGDKIDKGQIPGRILGIKPNEPFYIYAYTYDHPDSMDPGITKADFLTMPDNQGNFKLNYIPMGTYRIFVIEDINRNLRLDPNIERIGIPWRDVTLDSIALTALPMMFNLTKVDTTPPVAIDSRALNNRTVMVRLSEPMAKGKVAITDTLSGDTLAIRACYQDPASPNQYIFLTEVHDSTTGYRVSISAIMDSSGNGQPVPQHVFFSGSAQIDTTRFRLMNSSPRDSLKDVSLMTPVILEFSLPVDTASVARGSVLLSGRGDTLAESWKWKALTTGEMVHGKHFLPGNTYRYTISLGKIKSVWGEVLNDTSFTHTFFMVSENEFGSISGKYLGDASQNVYIVNMPLESKQAPVRTKVQTTGHYLFEWLLDGKYKLGGFVDQNNDGFHSKGNLIPFQFAEPYYLMDDTIRVKKRWEKSNVNFRIPGVE